jgi:transposase
MLSLSVEYEVRALMEATGRYHEPVAAALHEAGLWVCVLNPILIKQSGAGSVRKGKTDKKDAIKIAKYGIDNWKSLREHTPVDAVRQQLKLFSRQYNKYMSIAVALQNNLIALLDKVFPGVNDELTSPTRADGHTKWVDFVITFWHRDCVCYSCHETFTERYRKWCKRHGYQFSDDKVLDLCAIALGCFPTLPKNANTKLLITTAAKQLTNINVTLVGVKVEMLRLSAMLPEHALVTSMYGVGKITGAQLMAEIGDVRNFDNRSSLVGFAGVDPAANQSGTYNAKSVPTSKRGSSHLRKTLFQIASTHLKRSPADKAIYQFIDRKRAEGKPYYVYMTAGMNKFLRIYYARVKELLNANDGNV